MKRFLTFSVVVLSLFLYTCNSKTERIHRHILKANEYIHLSNYEAALKELDKCEQIDKDNPMASYLRGNIYATHKQYEQAIEMYDIAIELDEYFVDAYINRGRSWFYLGNKDKRCEDFLKAESLGATNLKDDTKFCK